MQETGQPIATARRPTLLAGALALLALVLAVYGGALAADDLLIDAPFRATPEAAADAEILWGDARDPGWAHALRLSRAQDARLWKRATFGVRLHGILLHATIAILAFLLMARGARAAGAAFLAAALFALNPLNAGAVLWLGGRGVLLPLALVLLAAVAGTARPRSAWRTAASLALAAAAACALSPEAWRMAPARWPDQPWRLGAALYAPGLLLAAGLVYTVRARTRSAPPRRIAALALALLALVAFALGTHRATTGLRSDETLLLRLLAARPGNEPARVALGRLYLRAGQPGAAEQQFAALGPRRADWALALLEASDAPGAADRLRLAARLAPSHAPLRRKLADAELDAGHADAAFSNYVAALKLNPRDADALFGLGVVMRGRGQPADAADFFRQALELDPGHSGAAQQLDAVAPPGAP